MIIQINNMRKIPNHTYSNIYVNQQVEKSDLYTKFRMPFDKITDKDFDTCGLYNKKAYVSAAPVIEKSIKETLNSSVNRVVPLIGYKGIGKTHLMLHTLMEFYGKDNIHSNKVYIIQTTNSQYDILMVCAHERYSETVLEKTESLLCSRIEAICKEMENVFLSKVSDDDVQRYINSHKSEINYYIPEAKKYSRLACKLKYLIEMNSNNIRNFVFIYDDLESLTGKKQYSLIKDFLAFYECLRNGEYRDVGYKFFFCLRTSTYYNVCHKEDFDTHRVATAMILNTTPSLSNIFETRFNLIVNNFSLLKNAGNPKTWKDAYDILLELSNRIDSCSKDLLLELNDFNISEALNDFVSILSNRYWTQKNKNSTASFKIKGEEYYINNANIFRVLLMGEGNVYCNNELEFYPSLFMRPGFIQIDFLCMYILTFYHKKYQVFRNSNNFSELSGTKEDLLAIFNEILNMDKEKMMKNVYDICKCFINRGIIKLDDFPRENEESNSPDKIYLTPKGNALYEQFFSSSILFEIYRDEFSFDDRRYNTKLSCELKQKEVFGEFFLYIKDFWNYEKDIVDCAYSNNQKDDYISYFGDQFITQKMLNALERTVNIYYTDKEEESKKISADIKCFCNEIEKEYSHFFD